MQKNIKAMVSSPWFAVTLGVVAISVVYVGSLMKQPDAFAADAFCPVEICQGDHCDKTPGCEHGHCSNQCPGNCPQNS